MPYGFKIVINKEKIPKEENLKYIRQIMPLDKDKLTRIKGLLLRLKTNNGEVIETEKVDREKLFKDYCLINGYSTTGLTEEQLDFKKDEVMLELYKELLTCCQHLNAIESIVILDKKSFRFLNPAYINEADVILTPSLKETAEGLTLDTVNESMRVYVSSKGELPDSVKNLNIDELYEDGAELNIHNLEWVAFSAEQVAFIEMENDLNALDGDDNHG